MYTYLNVCKQMTDVKLLYSSTWNHLTVCTPTPAKKTPTKNKKEKIKKTKKRSGSFKNVIKKMCLQIIFI